MSEIKVAEWIESDLIDGEVAFQIEQRKEKGLECDEEKVSEAVYADSGWWQSEWEVFCEDLSGILREINPGNLWACEVSGFGWRNLDGSKVFQAESAGDWLRELLPDCDCQFKIYRDGNEIRVNAVHHDSPMWGKEQYSVHPADYCVECGVGYALSELEDEEELGLLCKKCMANHRCVKC